jgi:hypothetical protein
VTAGSDSAATGGASGAAPATPAAPAPAQAGPPPQHAHIEAALGQITQWEQALQMVEQQDARLAAYGEQLPEQMRQEIAQRTMAMPLAREKLANARDAAHNAIQRLQLEGPSRHVIQTFLAEEAVKQVPTLDRADFYQRLSQVQAPDDVPIVAQQIVDLHQRFGSQLTNATRAANGTDHMGGSGGSETDRSQMSSHELLERWAKQQMTR